MFVRQQVVFRHTEPKMRLPIAVRLPSPASKATFPAAYSLQTIEPCRAAMLLVDHFKKDRRTPPRLSFSQRLNNKKLLPVERGGFCQDRCERCPLPLSPAVA